MNLSNTYEPKCSHLIDKKDSRYSKEILKSATLTFNQSKKNLSECTIFDSCSNYGCTCVSYERGYC